MWPAVRWASGQFPRPSAPRRQGLAFPRLAKEARRGAPQSVSGVTGQKCPSHTISQYTREDRGLLQIGERMGLDAEGTKFYMPEPRDPLAHLFHGVPDGAPAICHENARNEEAVRSIAGSTVE